MVDRKTKRVVRVRSHVPRKDEAVVVKPVREANVKHKKGKILCLVLKENKSCVFTYVKTSKGRFAVDKNTYFIEPSGTYEKSSSGHVAVYLEGISLPIHHGYITRETITKTIMNLDGQKETHKLTKIKGLKYDSDLIDTVLNRKLADEFTKVHLDMPNLILAVMLIATVIIGVVNIGLQFYIG